MKNYRKALAALLLTLALTPAAFADDGFIHTDVAPPPPPPAADGFIHTGVAADGIMWTEASAALTDVGLSLLGIVTRL